MGSSIEIPVAVDTGGVEKSIQNGLIDPVEDAEKALENLGKTDVGRDLDKQMGRAQDATEDLSKELDRTRADLDKLGYAARDAGDDGKAGLGKIREGAQEVQREIGTNLGEAVSSIRGDLSDLGQVGQDTLGGLAATLASAGPAGIAGAAALAAGAVGLGLVTASLQEQQKEADALKARLSDAYRAAAEAGRDYIDQATVVAQWNDLAFNPDRAEEYKKVQETIKTTGLDVSTVMKANAGDLDALAIVQERATQAWRDQGEEANIFSDGLNDRAMQIRDYWNSTAAAAKESSDKTKAVIQGTTDYWKDQIATYGDVGVAIDEVGNKVVTLPDGKEIFIDAKTGQATEDVSKFKGDVDGTIDHLNGREVVVKARTQVDRTELDRLLSRDFRINVQANVVGPLAGGYAWQ